MIVGFAPDATNDTV